MFGKQITLFELFGFKIEVDASWLILVAVLTWSLATGLFPYLVEGLDTRTYWWMAFATVIGLFASLILHELAHSLVARRFAMPIQGITLFIFGGVARLGGEPPHAKAEFLVAIAGPIMSGCLAAFFYLLAWQAQSMGLPVALYQVFAHLGLMNVVLALFNLVPGFPLDGGRMFRAALWYWKGDLEWATSIASRSGSIFAFLLMGLGVLNLLQGDTVGGLWLIFIGFFLRSAAVGSYTQVAAREMLARQTVESVMTGPPVVAEADATIREFLDNTVYRHHHDFYPVVDGRRLRGTVTTRDVARVPKEDWHAARLSVITAPLGPDSSIDASRPAAQALEKMQRSGNTRLLVVREGKLLGIVTLKDLMHMLALRMELGDRRTP